MVRRRPSSRLLVLDEHDRVLLFRFTYLDAVLGPRDYWATPGGALETDETYADAARRELFEETGLSIDGIGAPVACKEFVLALPDGEQVMAEEQYFPVRVSGAILSRAYWTVEEHAMMTEHRWWSIDDLRSTHEVFFPEDLPALLARLHDGKQE